MRRILIVLIAFAFAGLFTVSASSFRTNAEDVATFSTQVSLTSPTTLCPRLDLPTPFVVRTDGGNGRILDPPPPPGFGGLNTGDIAIDSTDLAAQAGSGRYLTWRLLDPLPPTPCGYQLRGTPTLHIRGQVGTFTFLGIFASIFAGNATVHAGIFSCPSTAPTSTTQASCTLLTRGSSTLNAGASQAFDVVMGAVTAPLPAGEQLRFKVVVQAGGGSASVVRFQWGYSEGFQSTISIAP